MSTPTDNASTELPPVEYNLYVEGRDKKVEPYMTTITVNGATSQMEIVTASALTLISEVTYPTLWPKGKSPHLEPTLVRLQTYSGEELRVVGRAVVREHVEDLGLVVVGGGGPSLLGRDWLGRLKLDWQGICKLYKIPIDDRIVNEQAQMN